MTIENDSTADPVWQVCLIDNHWQEYDINLRLLSLKQWYPGSGMVLDCINS